MEEQDIENKIPRIIDKRNEALYYINFLIWPFGIMLASLKRWDRPWSKNVFWLFCIFFGLTFIIAKEGGADSDRYTQLFIQYANSDLSLKELWSSFYSESSYSIDIVSPIITFLVSRITDNPTILFTVFGLIFGYFYSRNIWYVLNKINGKLTGIIILFILAFALFNPIWNINGFRMNAAAQIFLFGTLPYLLEGKSKRLIWSGVAILVHFSFLFPVAILILFGFLRNRLDIYLVFFIATSFIKEIDLQYVQSVLSYLPDFFQSRISGYTNTEYAESINIANQSLNWYLPFAGKGISWIIYIMTLFTYFFCRNFLRNRQELMTLFCFSILLYGFSNISSLVPSGSRFISVANTFMFAFIIIFISEFPKIKGLFFVKAISVPLLLLYCIVKIRVGMDFYGLMTLFGNPIFAAFDSDPVPLIMGIKRLF